MITLTPAYGRDYKSLAAAKADLLEGKDFVLNDIMSPHDGRLCSARDFPGHTVQVRYNRKTKVGVVTL
jgi:hypothetical protein